MAERATVHAALCHGSIFGLRVLYVQKALFRFSSSIDLTPRSGRSAMGGQADSGVERQGRLPHSFRFTLGEESRRVTRSSHDRG